MNAIITDTDALTTELDLLLNNDQFHYLWLREMGREAIDRNAEYRCDKEGSCSRCIWSEDCDDKGDGLVRVDVSAATTDLEEGLESFFDELLAGAEVPGLLSYILSKAVHLIDYRAIARDVIEEIVAEDDELVSDEDDN